MPTSIGCRFKQGETREFLRSRTIGPIGPFHNTVTQKPLSGSVPHFAIMRAWETDF